MLELRRTRKRYNRYPLVHLFKNEFEFFVKIIILLSFLGVNTMSILVQHTNITMMHIGQMSTSTRITFLPENQ